MIFRDDLNSADVNDIIKKPESEFLNLTDIKLFDKTKPHWVKLMFENNTDELLDFILRGGRNSKETYYIVSNGQITEKRAGYFVPLNERDIEQNYLSKVNLSLPPNETTLVIIKVESLDNLPLDLGSYKLQPRSIFESDKLHLNIFQGVFSGVLLILGVLSLFFYGRSKSKVFLSLALYSFCHFFYFAHVHGLIELYFFSQSPNIFPPIWLLPLLTSAAYLQLARDFNETGDHYQNWDRFFSQTIYVCLALFLVLSIYLFVSNDYYTSITILQTSILILIGVGLVFLFHIFQTGRAIHKYFVYGSVVLLFSVTISIINQLFYLSNSMPYFVQFGLIVEMIIFCLGLSYKAQLEYDEHDITQRSLILQLQQNDKLKEDINLKLREEVADRTLELRFKNKELLEAKDAAEKATASKSEFLSVMSHEIRTPLNAIISLSHIMEIDNKDKTISEYIDALKFSSESLHSLINDVLDYNKIEADKLKIESIEFSLIDMLRNISEIFKFKAKNKGIELRIEIGEHTPDRLLGDPTRLTQIFNNLLSNAIKFTNEGHVTLKVYMAGVKDEKAMIHFDVIDTGVGIPSDKIETIFNEFEQASNSTTREFGGTGLGLSITQKLLKLMGSEINVSENGEKGSKFSFEIPFVINKSFNIFSQGQLHLERDLKKASILVVDDNDMNRLVLKRLFSIWNADFSEASGGERAIELCSQKQFDLVLMDIEMRPIDGFETVATLLQEPSKNDSVPFIAMSAYQTEEFEKDLHGAGFKGFVHKPFDPDELYERIIQHLDHQNVEE